MTTGQESASSWLQLASQRNVQAMGERWCSLVELAPQLGYRYLAIESANAHASTFAERLGFSPRDNGRHWIGAVDDVQKVLNC